MEMVIFEPRYVLMCPMLKTHINVDIEIDIDYDVGDEKCRGKRMSKFLETVKIFF